MALHDAYARLTPFEVAFPGGSALEALARAVDEEARHRGADETDPEAFMKLTAVAEHVRSLRAPDAPPEATYPLAAFLFQAVRFERAGRPLYLLETRAARSLTGTRVGAGRPPAAPLEPPTPAGYLQLPRHLVWTEADAATSGVGAGGGGPGSVDGVFWALSRRDVLHALPITGLLPDGPGFAALPLPAAPLADAPLWLEGAARPSGRDFESTLPGGELDELYSVRAAGEVLKLLAGFFVLVRGAAARLETLGAGRPRDEAAGDAGKPATDTLGRAPGAPRPSSLPYTRVSLPG